MLIYSFPSVSAANARILILGTMPGIPSLMAGEYYGNVRNNFWKLMFTILDVPFSADYTVKKTVLIENRIALWDVLQACKREGSLDSAIEQEIPNDFTAFLEQHPEITHIFFNGQKAAAYFKKYVTTSKKYELVVLPSTSPANAGKNFESKLKEWENIRKPIGR
ncbi:DNA-deoxyinosine glycosylase [Flavobacterium cerinum]|uniref:DNA-deoxyinosine glycosylase n=1 Tax=Flavobacterium cerinum TaxID=2502784 RepID=A0ABY5IRP8_9FLAO|nr:DNA-deoxyinosine glycosylase [Flavobacterium cerinum]UUC44945.1 DNA-deoxyinosine glycosylase [Flavobacterium cerinum]